MRGFLTNPLSLISLSENEKKKIENLFPFSVGMEVETCPLLEDYKSIIRIKGDFEKVGLLDLDINNCEQRFRFCNGLKGAIQVYDVCKLLHEHMYFNEGSGIHYHIDFTDMWEELERDELKNQDWILEELDKWDYKGSYNKRGISPNGNWIRWNGLKTLEFRIGNMSFDYREIIRRIISAQSISVKVKYLLSSKENLELLKLQKEMRKLSEQKIEEEINKEEIIKSRIIRI